MKSTLETKPIEQEAPELAVEVQVAAPSEVEWFDRQLVDHHYLGAGRSVGDYLLAASRSPRARGGPAGLGASRRPDRQFIR